MELEDRKISCLNCGKEFVYTVRDQEYYAKMGFKNPPKRCRECRALMKRERQFATTADGGSRELFKATCVVCGRPAYVPFKPTGCKPIYCRDCLVLEKMKKPQDQESASLDQAQP